jgi:ornithine decarboxylase
MQLKFTADIDDPGLATEKPLSQFQEYLSNLSPQTLLTDSACTSEEAFFMCDLGKIVHQVQLWRQCMPRVLPFYAVKCNDDAQVLKLLAALGCGFDCASKGEIGQLVKLGISSDRVIYANPCKQISHVKYAAANNVDLMTFDSEEELIKVKKAHSNAMMVLRIATDDSAAVCQLGMKFGAQLTRCRDILTTAKRLEIAVVGVSFHVGSGCLDADAYDVALKNASDVFRIANSLGFEFSVLDIGGGFPGFVATDSDHPAPTFEQVAAVVNEGLDRHFSGFPDVTVIAEPGRFMCASAFTLATGVISVKMPAADSCKPGDVGMCYINDGVYGSFNCLLFDHARVTPKSLKSYLEGDSNLASCDVSLEKTALFSVWGPTCDGLDKINNSCELPADLAPGDWLVFDNMGAYTLAAASTFNGFPRSQVKYHISQNMLSLAEQEIRKPFSVQLLAPSPPACTSVDSEDSAEQIAYLEDLFVNLQLPVVSF